MLLYYLRVYGLFSLSFMGWLVSIVMGGMKGDQIVGVVEDCFLH